jgi:putative flippase GtrA
MEIRNLINPFWWWRLAVRERYLHFFIVGATGVAINLAITAFFAELVFGRERYFTAYVIGLVINLAYNFILHTIVTFKTKGDHVRRLTIFVVYSLILTFIQAQVVKYITNLVGVNWYLIVIAGVIFFFSIVTFLLFKFVLFRDPGSTVVTDL